jgi:hypothetical protein
MLVALVTLLTLGGRADAGIIVFSGSDPGAGPSDPRPNSDAAAAAFAAAATQPSQRITFEGLPLGNFSSLAVAPGVTVTLAQMGDTFPAGISNSNSAPVTLGYNTTPGGSQFLQYAPTLAVGTSTATFSFANPVQGFGAYFTGLGTNPVNSVHLVFNDGMSEDILLTGNSAGGVQFFGFLDPGASFSSLSVQEGTTATQRDIFGIDDVRLVYAPAAAAAAAIPEPATAGLFVLGLAGLAGLAVRRWRRR